MGRFALAGRTRRTRVTKTVCVVAAGITALAVTGAPGADAATPKTVTGSLPAWVAKAHALGRADAKDQISFKVYLTPNGGVSSLKADVNAVSDPKSTSYRHFLTAKQYHAKYDATDASLAKVTAWLSAKHLKVTGVESQRRYVTVTSTVSRTEAAFAAKINRYTHAGKTVQANASALKVPAAIAPLILTVAGIDTTPRLMKHDTAPPPAAYVNARPCSTFYGQVTASKKADYKTPLPKLAGKYLPYSVCGYTGPQLRSAYEDSLSDGLTGAGVSVAITDAFAAPTIAADASTYARNHGDSSYAKGQLSQVLPKSFRYEDDCGASGWFGEETLDVEAVHAMAPDAKIKYYGARSCANDDFNAVLAKVVDDNKVQLVSNSWGDPGEQYETSESIAAFEQPILQGAMQGISFMFSSGDNGDEVANSGLKQADFPASDPFVTAVGGTADAIGQDGSLAFQTGWGTRRYSLSLNPLKWTANTYLYGAGGGESSLFNQPAYQQGIVPAGFGGGRAVPDVGLDADPTTGMLIGETQTFPDGTAHYGEYRIGGTSLASPLFAGMSSLLVQNAGGRLGLLNPLIYSQYGTGTFNDVKGAPADRGNVRADFVNGIDASGGIRYTVRTFDQDASLDTAKGWDPVTGVGSPNVKWITSVSKK